MVDRLLKVNAYTTLDYVEAEVEGHDLADEAPAVLDVTADREAPDHVELNLELDDALEAVPHHVDRVTLSAAEARKVAADLERYADRVDAAESAAAESEATTSDAAESEATTSEATTSDAAESKATVSDGDASE